MASLDHNIWHSSLSLQCYDNTESSSFLLFSMEQKRGFPLDNCWGTSMNLTSGVCIAYYKFPGCPYFKWRGLQMYRSVTTHTHHLYHSSSSATSHVLIHPWTIVESSDLVWPLCQSTGPQIVLTSSNLAPDSWIHSTLVWQLPLIEHKIYRHGGCSRNNNVPLTSHMLNFADDMIYDVSM